MSITDDTPSLTDVKNYLKEADSYDVTLSENEMLELYQVLKHSKSTASEEDEQRRIFEQTEANCSLIDELRRESVLVRPKKESLPNKDKSATESYDDVFSSSDSEEDVKASQKKKPFTPKTWSAQKKQPKALCDDELQLSSSEMPKLHIQQRQEGELQEIRDTVDVFDSVPTTHKPLKQISRNPEYNSPFYCNPKITGMEYKKRAYMISSYHIALLHKYSSYQRQSIMPAPWGKAIQTTLRFNGSLMRKTEKSVDNVDSSQDDIGVCGNELLDNPIEEKNSEDEFETYISKSGRHTKRKLYAEDEDSTEWKKKSRSSPSEDLKKTQTTKKRRGAGSFTNDEIMKRSRLFSDGNTVTTTRSDKMFENLIENDRKKKDGEKEMEKFSKTLERCSDDEDDEKSVSSIAELIHSEEPFLRRRVVPPSGIGKTRGGGRGRGKKNVTNKKSSRENSSQEVDSSKYNSLEYSLSTTRSNSKLKDRCPMCNEEFFQCELAEHASVCVDTYSENNVSTTTPSDFTHRTLTCAKCDEVLPLDMNYEVHVKDCMPERK